MTIHEIQDEIIEEFKWFEGDDTEKMQYIIDLGKSLPAIDEKLKIDQNKIKGCQSDLWFNAEFEDGKIVFTATAAAIIPRGIASILIRIYSNQTSEDILKDNTSDFLKRAGLESFFSMTRSNGLESLVNKIKHCALRFCLKQ